MKRRIFAVLAFLTLGLSVHAQSEREWQSKFNTGKPEARQEAYAKLDALDAKTLAVALKALRKVHDNRIKLLENDLKRLGKVFPNYNGNDERMEKILAPWLKARASAWEIIFDKERYPMPPSRRASGPMKGHEIVRPRLDALKKIFKPIEGLSQKAFATVSRGNWGRSIDKTKKSVETIEEVEAILAKHDKDHKAYASPTFDFYDALVLLGRKNFSEANNLYSNCTKIQKILYFLVVGQYIEYYNSRVIRSGMDKTSLKAVAKINEYRRMLGVLPYEADLKLTKAIQGHMKDCDDGKTPFGHMSNVPGKRSAQDRCKKEGWTGGASENLSSGGAIDSVEGWFWDGGHGRNQMSPDFRKIGFATGGKGCGFNNGSGGDVEVARPASPF